MIIHKLDNQKLPHEGLEYFHKSREPETYTECLELFCWLCVFDKSYMFFQQCKHYQFLKEKGI